MAKKLVPNKEKLNKNSFEKKGFFVKNKDLLKRILFTIIVLVIIRIGMLIVVPGIQMNDNSNSEADKQEFFNLLSTLGGGNMGKFSIFSLGVSPYITASIITQLLSTDVIPILSQWTKSGERGRRKLDKLTKALTIPFCVMQGTATIFTLKQYGMITPKWELDGTVPGPIFYFLLVPLVMLAGTFIMLWMADQITIKGIGNGVSIIIFAGIVAKLPSNFIKTYDFWASNSKENTILFSGLINFLIYIAAFLFVILIITLVNEGERKIPIQQTGSGLASVKEHIPYLPLKANNAGVIPVIFASALISTPITISQIVQISNPTSGFVWFCNNILSFQQWAGISIYAILIIMFTFLYSQVQINPEKIADNFKKSGTFIPGIKTGEDTRKFLSATINRLSCMGSLFLAFLAALPYIIAKLTDLPSNLAIGGTGLIIVISVALQTTQQLKGRLIQQSFIDKKFDKFDSDNSSTHIW
ncbi:preprotein translocase subunit SecY [Spiroplasma endosymbiont of Crioceris asparagi]|uniref:preprotein translocase subunit SecY n=1 Tax=Spiroplasma endosymbiont of Crioceris asparagi TaxID=3066286 RepID=UPI0030CE5FCC